MKSWRKWLLARILRDQKTDELSNPYVVARLESIMLLSVIGIAALIIFGALNLRQGDGPLGIYELIAAALFGLNLVVLATWRHIEFSTNMLFVLLLPLVLYLMYSGGIGGSGVIWLFVFPPAVFYITGLRAGLAWMLLLSLGLAILAFSQYFNLIQTQYSLVYMRQLAACLMVVTLIIYFHERVSDIARRKEVMQSEVQETLNEQLEVGKRRIEEDKVRYEALLESIGDGIMATDAQGRILLANQAALTMLGLELTDIIGKRYDVFAVEDEHGRRIPYEERVLSQVLKSNRRIGTTITSQYYYVASNGHRFPVASTQTPISIGGQVTGAVSVFRDISQEKRIDQAKTELVSLASHQLNGPLTAVSWYTEMLMSGEAGKLTKQQQDYLREIYAGSAKMVDLVNDFLNISRLELGTFVPKYQMVNVAALVDETIKELMPEVERKHLTVTKKYAGLPEVSIDKRLIQIIAQNLMTNAVKYTLDKDHITFEMHLSGKGRTQHLNVEVSDTGMGIPASEQSHVFTKMYRAENAKVKEAEGTGLGLYIVKSIIEQLRGTIHLQSEEGKGTTFTIAIPIGLGDPAAPATSVHHRG